MNPINSPEVSEGTMNRRTMLGATGLAGAASWAVTKSPLHAAPAANDQGSFRYCLNMSTIRGQELSVEEEIDVAGKAGYDGIEPWLGKLNGYKNNGGSLKDLKKRIDDHGLAIESAIGFASWIVNDDAKRKKGFEDAKRDMDLLAQLGGKRIAAPPAGVGRDEVVTMMDAAARYHELLEVGSSIGVIPQIEMWGGHKTIGRVSTAIYIAIEACLLYTSPSPRD